MLEPKGVLSTGTSLVSYADIRKRRGRPWRWILPVPLRPVYPPVPSWPQRKYLYCSETSSSDPDCFPSQVLKAVGKQTQLNWTYSHFHGRLIQKFRINRESLLSPGSIKKKSDYRLGLPFLILQTENPNSIFKQNSISLTYIIIIYWYNTSNIWLCLHKKGEAKDADIFWALDSLIQ